VSRLDRHGGDRDAVRSKLQMLAPLLCRKLYL
jgi:hypothetical protein